MSVLVKGMEMSESCLSCPFQQWDGEDTVCYFTGISALNIGRQGACPINEGYDVGYLAGRRDSEQKWIPVTERLPEVNKYVLGYFKDGSMTAVCFFDIDEHMTFWRACTDEGWEADCDSEPTHWMPLPSAPTEE